MVLPYSRDRHATNPPPDADQADAWIRRHFRRHSRTFSLATALLPRPVRLPVGVVYLFCRTVDDIADAPPGRAAPDDRMARLGDAARSLEAALAGAPPPHLLWVRLAHVVRTWGLPHGPFRELIEGARWDLEGRPVRDLPDLVAYSELVAGSVGEMVLPFLVRDRRRLADLVPAARELGVAMQITNILRDVGEDRRALGRCYLPEDWLREAGLEPARDPDPSDPRYRALLERLMTEAERRYAGALSAVRHLPRATRIGIRAAARLYREILNEIRANAYDNLTRRAVVPRLRKLLLVASDRYAARRGRLLEASVPPTP